MTDQQHDDVDLLLECSQLEAIELMAEDPKYYLGLVENYRTRRDGSSVYLPYELNTNVNRRADGRLIIQFKLDRNGRWYEVGYDGGESFTDEDAYRAFAEKAKLLLKYPPPERSHLCEQALGDPSNVAEYAPNQTTENGSGNEAESQMSLPDFLKPVNSREIVPSRPSFEELLKNRDTDLAATPQSEFSFFKPPSNKHSFTEEDARFIISVIRTTPEKFREEVDNMIVKLLLI